VNSNFEKYTIDRFEGDLAVLLLRDDERVEKIVPRKELGDVSDGDILLISFDDSGMVLESVLLVEETEQARNKAEELLEEVRKMNG
jgi:hypothetical protein